jgi:hypothetical protein
MPESTLPLAFEEGKKALLKVFEERGFKLAIDDKNLAKALHPYIPGKNFKGLVHL